MDLILSDPYCDISLQAYIPCSDAVTSLMYELHESRDPVSSVCTVTIPRTGVYDSPLCSHWLSSPSSLSGISSELLSVGLKRPGRELTTDIHVAEGNHSLSLSPIYVALVIQLASYPVCTMG